MGDKIRKPYNLTASGTIGKVAERITNFKAMFSPGTGNSTLEIADQETAAGTALIKVSVPANGPPIMIPLTRLTTAGYATITGTGASLTIWPE